ncbi:hypothetical protein Ciccas_007714 [Cichlidogyrus casuarinus]|uniref:PDZ domain-containing protein n=1 Tax=Cichlidogyrus casuarinus TaxID=1844966 RepID=A0ABD2Q238_9PLAT
MGHSICKTPQISTCTFTYAAAINNASIPVEVDCALKRVDLTRDSASRAWGIVISGTDDTPNAPILIDSLTPGDPGYQSGLLSVGDRIMAINGAPVYQGFTLSQAMQKLQQFPDKVMLHVMRPHVIITSDTSSRRKTQSLRKVSAHPSFNKSIDTYDGSRHLESSLTSSLSGSFPNEGEEKQASGKRANSSSRALIHRHAQDASLAEPLVPNHIHHGRSKSDVLDMANLEKIQCIGCREAIAYEMGQKDAMRLQKKTKKEGDAHKRLLANDSLSFESNHGLVDDDVELKKTSRSSKKTIIKSDSSGKLRPSRSDSKLNDELANVVSGQQTPNSQVTVVPGPPNSKLSSSSAFKNAITKVKSR